MRTLPVIAGLVCVLVACAKPAGGPLSHTFDNTKIASVPLEQKQPVTEAQQQHEVALLQRTTAGASYADSEIEVDLAEYQAERAEIVSQIVASRQPEAKPAAPSAETAALARKTADAKVAFVRARRAWLEKQAEWSLFAVYAAQAKLELERAKVAQANRLTAADFNLDAFQKQADNRGMAAKLASDEAETARKSAEGKLAEWSELEKQYLQASSVQGPLESSRYAKEWIARPAAPPEAPPAAAPPAEEPAAPPMPEPVPASTAPATP